MRLLRLSVPEEQREAVLDVAIQYRTPGPFSGPRSVTGRLSRTSDRSSPDLLNALDRAISGRTGEDVLVKVTYTDYDRSERGGENDQPQVPGTDGATGINTALDSHA